MAHREPHPETLTPFTLSTGDPFPLPESCVSYHASDACTCGVTTPTP